MFNRFNLLRLAATLLLTGTLNAALILPTTNGDGAAGDNLGYAITHCGVDTFATALGDQQGRPDSANGQVVGSVYRIQYQGEQPSIVEKLQALVPDDEAFGVSVACAAQGLFVGATTAFEQANADVGTVHYFYQINGVWTSQGEISRIPNDADARFGASIAASARWLAVSASGLSNVYVYERSGASVVFRRTISSPIGLQSGFGSALFLEGDALWIGAPDQSTAAGSAFRFDLNSGLQTIVLTGPPGFGASFARSTAPDWLWIGAPRSGNQGAVLGFDAALNLRQTLTAPGTQASPVGFGAALATSGSALVVGAPFTTIATASFVGSAYHYQLGNTGAALLTRIDPPVSLEAGVSNTALFAAGLAFNETGALVLSASQANGASLPLQGQVYALRLGAGSALTNASTGRGLSYERIGQSISADAQTLVSGSAFAASIFGPETGRAYVFESQGSSWNFSQVLEPPDTEVEQRFGSAVAVQGDRIVVGSIWNVINQEFDAGSAYVFEKTARSWQFLQKLSAETPSEFALFGSAVAISGDWIAVGARAARSPDVDQGRVSLFHRQANGRYLFRQTLAPPGTAAFDLFGASLAMQAGNLVVGAPGARRAGSVAGGRAYHYSLQNGVWSLQNELLDALGGSGAGFGLSVAINESAVILVSAPLQGAGELSAVGVVLRFNTNGALLHRQFSPVLEAGALFGISLAMRGAETLIGASGLDRDSQPDSGVAYYFADPLAPVQTLALPTTALAGLGRSAALPLNRTNILVGAPGLFRANPQEGGIFSIAAPLSDATQFRDGFEALVR
jgi:FG-GAP repeat